LVWLKLGLEIGIEKMFLDFFFVTGLSCIIMISLIVVIFEFAGMLMFVSLYYIPIFASMLQSFMEIIVRPYVRLYGLI